MGGTKRELERHEAAVDWARGKLLEHGYLAHCKVHDDEIVDTLMGSSGDIGEILADLKLRKDYWPDVITTRDELVAALKSALDNTSSDCGLCAKWDAD